MHGMLSQVDAAQLRSVAHFVGLLLVVVISLIFSQYGRIPVKEKEGGLVLCDKCIMRSDFLICGEI